MGFTSENNSLFADHSGGAYATVRAIQTQSAPTYLDGKDLASVYAVGDEADADDEDSMEGGVYVGGSWKSISRSINRGARDLGGDIRRSANATGRDINRSAMQTGRDINRDLIKPSGKVLKRETNRAIKQATQEAKQLGKELEQQAKMQSRAIKAEVKAQSTQALKDLRRSVRPSGAFGQFTSALIDEVAPAIGQGLGAGIGTLAGNPGLGSAVGERLAGMGRDELKTRTGYGRARGRTQYSPLPFAIAGGAKPKGKGGGARGALIRKIMQQEGCSLPQASKLIKQRGLY